MSMDLQDLYLVNAMNARNNIHTRAKQLQDTFGVTPIDIEEYRRENGGFGGWRALGIVVACIGIAAVIGVALGAATAMAPALFIGFAAASVFSTISMVMQNEKVMRGYESYLDVVAAQARESQGMGRAPRQAIEYDNPTPRIPYTEQQQQRAAQAGLAAGVPGY